MSEAAMLKQYRLKIKELERQIKQGVIFTYLNSFTFSVHDEDLPCFEFGKVHSKGLFTVIFYFSHN
jgi:hypothetical protein